MINFSFDVAQAEAVFEHVDRAKVLVFVLKVSFLCVLCHLVELSPPALLQHLRVAGSSAAWGWSPQGRVRPDSRAPRSPLLGPPRSQRFSRGDLPSPQGPLPASL